MEMNTDEFARDLAKIAAKQLIKRLASSGRITVDDVTLLQDATSLFSPYTFDAIMDELRNAGAKITKNVFSLRKRK